MPTLKLLVTDLIWLISPECFADAHRTEPYRGGGNFNYSFPVIVTKSLTLEKEAVAHNTQIHDDVIKWKHFPRYWPFVKGIHRSPFEQTVEIPVVWDALALIMTSL